MVININDGFINTTSRLGSFGEILDDEGATYNWRINYEFKTHLNHKFSHFGVISEDTYIPTMRCLTNHEDNNFYFYLSDNDGNSVTVDDNSIIGSDSLPSFIGEDADDSKWVHVDIKSYSDISISDVDEEAKDRIIVEITFDGETYELQEPVADGTDENGWEEYTFEKFESYFYVAAENNSDEPENIANIYLKYFEIYGPTEEEDDDNPFLIYELNHENGTEVEDTAYDFEVEPGEIVNGGWRNLGDDGYCADLILEDIIQSAVKSPYDGYEILEGEEINAETAFYFQTIVGDETYIDVQIAVQYELGGTTDYVVIDDTTYSLKSSNEKFEFTDYDDLISKLEGKDFKKYNNKIKDSVGYTNDDAYNDGLTEIIVNYKIYTDGFYLDGKDFFQERNTTNHIYDVSIKPNEDIYLNIKRPIVSISKQTDTYEKDIDSGYRVDLRIYDNSKFDSGAELLHSFNSILSDAQIKEHTFKLPENVVDKQKSDDTSVYVYLNIDALGNYNSKTVRMILTRYRFDTKTVDVNERFDSTYTDEPYLFFDYQTIIESDYYSIIPPYLTPKRSSSVSESEGIYFDKDFVGNEFDVKLYEMYGDKEINCRYTSSLGMSLSSNIMKIQNTNYIEHIKKESAEIELDVMFGDIWKDGKILTHRDLELSKLRDMYENNSMIAIKSNITSDISEVDERGYDRDGVTIMRNFVIQDIEITQSSDSANFYEASITLKHINVVDDVKTDYRYARRIGDIARGIVDTKEITLPSSEEIEEEEKEDELGIFDYDIYGPKYDLYKTHSDRMKASKYYEGGETR